MTNYRNRYGYAQSSTATGSGRTTITIRRPAHRHHHHSQRATRLHLADAEHKFGYAQFVRAANAAARPINVNRPRLHSDCNPIEATAYVTNVTTRHRHADRHGHQHPRAIHRGRPPLRTASPSHPTGPRPT